MLSSIILRSTAAFGGAPFSLKKCTALGSVGAGAGAGGVVGGVPGALVGGALGVASSLLGGLFGNHNTNKINLDRKSTRLNSSHITRSRMPSSA